MLLMKVLEKKFSASAHHHHHHGESSQTKEGDDNYTFNPKDIVSETQDGYVVRHGDHFHYIPKNKVEKPVEAVKPAQVIPTPSLPEVKNEEKQKEEEAVERPSVLSFAGVQFETSDGFKLSGDRIITPTSTELLVAHSGHQHFIFYKQLVNFKFEKLIPHQYLNKAKKNILI